MICNQYRVKLTLTGKCYGYYDVTESLLDQRIFKKETQSFMLKIDYFHGTAILSISNKGHTHTAAE